MIIKDNNQTRLLENLGFTDEVIENYRKFEDECIAKGFTFKSLIEAREKQIPKKPIEEEKQYSEDYGFNSDILCPVCNNYIGYYTEAMCKPEYMQYCNECGQRIDNDWSGKDE
jgi:Asp-tRNA(Asn)/Glu-tRNA(Gln) amidotransferase B subunit